MNQIPNSQPQADQPMAGTQPQPPPLPETNKKPSLYQASYGEVFAKNFLAGLGRATGTLILYIIVVFVLYLIFAPKIISMVSKIEPLLENLNQNPMLNQNQDLPIDINQIFQQYAPR